MGSIMETGIVARPYSAKILTTPQAGVPKIVMTFWFPILGEHMSVLNGL